MVEISPKLAVVLSFVFSIVSNAIFATGAIGGRNIGKVSDENPTYVTPDGMTFSIWGVIYLLEAILVYSQYRANDRAEQLLAETDIVLGLEVRPQLVIVFMANAMWLPIFVFAWFKTAFIIIVVMLAYLASVYMALNPSTMNTPLEWLTLAAGIACNTSWVVVAACLNLFVAAGEDGWKDFDGPYGVSGTPVAAAFAVLLISVLGSVMVWLYNDFAWSLVASWAIWGIYRMQTTTDQAIIPDKGLSPLIAEAAKWCNVLLLVVSAAAVVLFARKKYVERQDRMALASYEAAPLKP
mmetsp:Transcript_22027/g.39487  ORF Transcript_22027/g.39487 Transcript_22027/m.39487 type:complete len:295 (+) Transcript_22027:49-933(+)